MIGFEARDGAPPNTAEQDVTSKQRALSDAAFLLGGATIHDNMLVLTSGQLAGIAAEHDAEALSSVTQPDEASPGPEDRDGLLDWWADTEIDNRVALSEQIVAIRQEYDARLNLLVPLPGANGKNRLGKPRTGPARKETTLVQTIAHRELTYRVDTCYEMGQAYNTLQWTEMTVAPSSSVCESLPYTAKERREATLRVYTDGEEAGTIMLHTSLAEAVKNGLITPNETLQALLTSVPHCKGVRFELQSAAPSVNFYRPLLTPGSDWMPALTYSFKPTSNRFAVAFGDKIIDGVPVVLPVDAVLGILASVLAFIPSKESIVAGISS